jgi:bacteriocin resistance YdeI/OmpD-like protein/uncharacterized protein DUF1905
MNKFKAQIEIIGINPFVFVPDRVLKNIFKQAGKDKGPIPIRGTVNGNPYRQTLVKYRGAWRLYVNTIMLKNSPKRIGDVVAIEVEFDPSSRDIRPHPKLVMAFRENKKAKRIFDNLPPSRQNEILRYISFLKTEESVIRNIKKAIDHLAGKEKFVGRDKP